MSRLAIHGWRCLIYVTRDLEFSTGVLGMIFAVGGVGSVAGAWLATRLDARIGAPRALLAGLVLGTLGAARGGRGLRSAELSSRAQERGISAVARVEILRCAQDDTRDPQDEKPVAGYCRAI